MQLRVQLGFTNAADYSIVEQTEEILRGLYVSLLWNPVQRPPEKQIFIR